MMVSGAAAVALEPTSALFTIYASAIVAASRAIQGTSHATERRRDGYVGCMGVLPCLDATTLTRQAVSGHRPIDHSDRRLAFWPIGYFRLREAFAHHLVLWRGPAAARDELRSRQNSSGVCSK